MLQQSVLLVVCLSQSPLNRGFWFLCGYLLWEYPNLYVNLPFQIRNKIASFMKKFITILALFVVTAFATGYVYSGESPPDKEKIEKSSLVSHVSNDFITYEDNSYYVASMETASTLPIAKPYISVNSKNEKPADVFRIRLRQKSCESYSSPTCSNSCHGSGSTIRKL